MQRRRKPNNPALAVNSTSTASALNSSSATTTPASLTSPATFFGAREIPQDIFNHLACFTFPDTSEGNAELLNQASVNPELAARYQNRLLNTLLTHVIRGEKAEAETMIQKLPGFLLLKGSVSDYSGRTIEGTALQMALGAEDVKCHDEDDDGMAEMIHHYLRPLPQGEAIIAKQTEEQFPEGWEFKEAQRAMRDSDVLNSVIDTIANSTNPAEWEKAIDTFRKYLEFENKSNVIQTGKHFNHQLLVEALNLYNQNYDRFGGFDSAKNNAAWRKVIGTIERYVPAATAQALCTGVSTIVDEKGKLQRKLFLHNYHSGRAFSYFPLDVDSGSVLGRDFAVFSYYGGGDGRWEGIRWSIRSRSGGAWLQNLCQTKTSNLQRLCSPVSPATIAASAARP